MWTTLFYSFLFIILIVVIMGSYQTTIEKMDDLQQRISQMIPSTSATIVTSDQVVSTQLMEGFDIQPLSSAVPQAQSSIMTDGKILTYCVIQHDHEQVGCNMSGVCNYPYPKKMSQLDRDLFLMKYPKDMTPQDYIHWLYAHDDPLQLDYIDYQNYRNRANGLTWENIRHIYQQTMTPFSSYHKMRSSKLPSAVESDAVLLPGTIVD